MKAKQLIYILLILSITISFASCTQETANTEPESVADEATVEEVHNR